MKSTRSLQKIREYATRKIPGEVAVVDPEQYDEEIAKLNAHSVAFERLIFLCSFQIIEDDYLHAISNGLIDH